jgi:hypothetical protein
VTLPPDRQPTGLERLALRLARAIAGPDRRVWIDALEAELRELDRGRTDWVLGGLVAAIKDRAWRERGYALAVIAAPTAALASIPFASLLTSALADAAGLSLALSPIVALSPLPFAVALGMVRPRRSAIISGTLGFTVYQALPAVTLPLLFGQYVYVRWEANLSAYGLLPPSGFIGSLGLWCFGAWAGASGARRRGSS